MADSTTAKLRADNAALRAEVRSLRRAQPEATGPCLECERVRAELVRLRRVAAAARAMVSDGGDIQRQWDAIVVELETLDARPT